MKFRWETEFKETEIGDIPRDWEVEAIKKVVLDIVKGKPPKKIKGDVPYLSAKYLRDEEEAEEYFIKDAGISVNEEDIIILWDGSNSGEIFKGKKGLLASTMCKLVFRENINKNFIYHILKLEEEKLKDAKSGTDDRHVDKEYFLTISIPFPHPSEQFRIATVLSWFDDLIENKKRQNEILEKVAMALFKNWFIDFEPFKNEEFVYNEDLCKEIPKGWEVGRIGEIAKIESGGNAPQKDNFFTDGKYPFVRVKHMSKGVCVEGCDFINEKAIEKYKLKIFSEGSLIIQKSGESLKEARVNIIPFNSCIVNHLAIFDASLNKNILDFLYCNLKQTIEEIIKGEAGTTLPYLRISDVRNLPLVIPPPPVLQSFNSIVEPIFQKIILNQKQIMLLRKIRDRLLPLLVFGKLRVEEI